MAGEHQPYPAQQYGQPYGTPAYGPTAEKNNLGNIGLIASIVGIVGSFIPVLNIVAGFGGIVGLVLGILGLRAANAGRATNRGMSIAAIVVGAVQIVLGILVIIGLAAFLSTYETSGFESL
ncbi:DUF4190 domain-containing protein [Georgenia thermotolerans]|uniref:DUF4190 domain-containing protein n=1 Tax=Georgenia thermotolerans TaxID=527326 RepID=A0A7J5USL3_9MICO|nr:DUF4190 domain-containing protein [Georgenia thermotolerans]KAE8765445.1 hypothetical protein GB883_04030 [Georgenia thermotolerans]